MSRATFMVVWLGATAALAVGLSLTVPRAVISERRAAAAESNLREAVRNAEVITRLRAEGPDAAADGATRGGLTPRVSAALERAGLPPGTLASMSPEAEVPVADEAGFRVLRRRATFALAGVGLPEIGRFLDAWRAAEPAWRPAGIDLSPVGGKAPAAGGNLPLRAVISIESITIRPTGDQR